MLNRISSDLRIDVVGFSNRFFPVESNRPINDRQSQRER